MLIETPPPPGGGIYNAAYLAGLRKRDEMIWADFYHRITPAIKAKLRANLFEAHLLEDLTQKVFVAVIEKIDAGEPRDPAKLASYVSGVCVNLALEANRQTKKDRDHYADVDPEILTKTQKSALDSLQRKELSRKVIRVLSEMKPLHREILIDHYYRGLTADEMCEKHGKKKEQIRMLRYRALKQFLSRWRGRK